MSARASFKEQALEALSDSHNTTNAGVADRAVARAQVFATLEVAEQQRIANLIAITELRRNPSNGGLTAPTQTVFDFPTDPNSAYVIKAYIKEALGLS